MNTEVAHNSTSRQKPWFWRLFTKPARVAEAPAPKITPPAKPCGKVLVVDDDAVIRKALQVKLDAEGYQVITAIDGPSAIQAVRTEHPDVVLLDVNFPPDVSGSWDGFGILTWLRRLDSSRHASVILISGNPGPNVWEQVKAAGSAGFLPKPIDLPALLSLIRYKMRVLHQRPAMASAK